MSVLIKGIDAPEYGFEEIRLYNNRAEYEIQDNEYADLEIEELPEPHDRLIDVDKIFNALRISKDVDDESKAKFMSLLLEAPTVIEAAGDEGAR